MFFEPPDGGVAENVLEVASGAAVRGWVPTVAGPAVSSIRERLEHAGVDYLAVPRLRRGFGRPLDDIVALRFIRSLIASGSFDVVHLHSAKAGVIGRAAALLSAAPVLYSPHCFGFVGDVSGRRRLLARWIERLLGRSTALIVCACEAERRRALQARIVPAKRLRRIYYGVPPCADTISPDQNLLNFRGGGLLVGAVTVLREQKRLDLLIDAAPQILARCPDARIAIIGNGPLEEELHERAVQRGLLGHERFAFLPFTPPSTRYLRALDLFVLPSAWEAMPIGALEALACGVPQVATDVEGTGEAVVASTGALIPPLDSVALEGSVIELLSDHSRRSAAANASRKRHHAMFEAARMVAETLEAYEHALGTPDQPDGLSSDVPAA